MGTYSDDRQPPLERLLLEPARRWGEGRFVVAGPQYPDTIQWSSNVERIEHLPPTEHQRFYNAQQFTLNITRRDRTTRPLVPQPPSPQWNSNSTQSFLG
ncbi:MAG: glycosyltransferase family protein [Coleofasciculus sp.]